MGTADELEKRIVELEVRLSFQDSVIESLNSVVREQHSRIDELAKQISALKANVTDDRFVEPDNSKPPHY